MRLQNKIIIFCLLFYGCSNELVEPSTIRGQILRQYTKEMKKKGLYVAGLGGGSKDNKISLIDVCFSTSCVLDIEKARKLIVDATTNLWAIMKSKKYQDYFDNVPASLSVIHITIIGKDREDDNPKYIQFTSIVNGSIHYDVKSKIPKFPPLDRVYQETFEEAQKILSESKPVTYVISRYNSENNI